MSWSNITDDIHVDQHDLIISPDDPNLLIAGNDGGIYVSYDRGRSYDHLNHVAIGQFYHVAVGPRPDYRVYGGLQDNGSWKGPSRSPGGITSGDWQVVGGGDGFWAFADPNDVNTLYVEYQGGQLSRVDVATGESKSSCASGFSSRCAARSRQAAMNGSASAATTWALF